MHTLGESIGDSLVFARLVLSEVHLPGCLCQNSRRELGARCSGLWFCLPPCLCSCWSCDCSSWRWRWRSWLLHLDGRGLYGGLCWELLQGAVHCHCLVHSHKRLFLRHLIMLHHWLLRRHSSIVHWWRCHPVRMLLRRLHVVRRVHRHLLRIYHGLGLHHRLLHHMHGLLDVLNLGRRWRDYLVYLLRLCDDFLLGF
jgi:hypothetical protein